MKHLPRARSVLKLSQWLGHLVLNTLGREIHHSHFGDGKIEAQSGEWTCPSSPTKLGIASASLTALKAVLQVRLKILLDFLF